MAAPAQQEHATDVGIRTLIAGDGVRGVGALFVFATHVCLLADPAQTNLLNYGWAAPILGHIDLALSAFFVLSGYLIARPFTRAYVAGTRRPRLRSYVRNRRLRVVPARLRPASLSVSLSLLFDASVAGARPKMMPVSKTTAKVKPSTGALISTF